MKTHPHYALIVAGIIFGLVSIMHLLRLIFKSRVIIAEKTHGDEQVPPMLSVVSD